MLYSYLTTKFWFFTEISFLQMIRPKTFPATIDSIITFSNGPHDCMFREVFQEDGCYAQTWTNCFRVCISGVLLSVSAYSVHFSPLRIVGKELCSVLNTARGGLFWADIVCKLFSIFFTVTCMCLFPVFKLEPFTTSARVAFRKTLFGIFRGK